MKAGFRNLIAGSRIALFMRQDENALDISWHSLVFIVLFTLATQVVIDYAIAGDAEFERYEWYDFHLKFFGFVLFASYIAAAICQSANQTLKLLIIFYNCLYLPLVALFYIAQIDPNYFYEVLNEKYESLFLTWSFLITFRLLSTLFNPQINRHLIATCMLCFVMYQSQQEIYLSHVYYNYQTEDNEGEERSLTAYQSLSAEEFFAKQDGLMAFSLGQLEPSERGTVDVYAITFGSYAPQGVFMREAQFVQETLDKRIQTKGRSLSMINHADTALYVPSANGTNLEKALKYISSISQPDEDIILLYFTSHGSKDIGLSVYIGGRFSLLNLDGDRLSTILDLSGLKNRVLIISACYSGSMMPPLENENTMIITAAANNKQSYGCSDTADLTYFARAYFKEAITETTDLESAYHIAKKAVEKREKDENLKEHSNPQIFVGENIRQTLSRYEKVTLINTEEPVALPE